MSEKKSRGKDYPHKRRQQEISLRTKLLTVLRSQGKPVSLKTIIKKLSLTRQEVNSIQQILAELEKKAG